MTMSSNLSTVTRNGNGVATSFSFPFKVWDVSQLEVYIVDASGAATKTTNWTATLSDSGGNVVYPASGGTVLPTGQKIVINRSMPFTQEVDLVQAEAFDPEVIETSLDMLTATTQQLKEAVGRAVKVDPGQSDPTVYLTEIRAAVAGTAADRTAADADAAATAADRIAVAADKTTTQGYRDTALGYANTATTQAATATTKASEASASAGTAATQAGNASASAADASTAKTAAQAAQAAAESAASSVSQKKYKAVATAGQTTITPGFSWSDPAGNLVVYINGLKRAVDTYTLASPTITLSSALAGGETIEVYSIDLTALPSTPLYSANNLSDVADKAAARSNLNLGDVAVKNVGTTTGTVCAGDDARLSAGGGDLALFAALKACVNSAEASHGLPNGWAWLCQSDELATKTNASYGSKAYENAGSLSTTATTLSSSYLSASNITSFSATTIINGTAAASEGGYVASSTPAGAYIQIDFGAGNPKALGKWNTYANAAASPCGWKAQYSDDASTWIDTTSGTVDFASGAWTTLSWVFCGSHRYWRIITTTVSGAQGWLSEIAVYEFGTATNATLKNSALTLGSAPNAVDLYLVHKAVDAVALNTDLKVRASRDGGTTWSGYGTLATVCAFDATYALLKAACDLSTTTSGTSLVWEITSYNAKSQQWRAVAVLLK